MKKFMFGAIAILVIVVVIIAGVVAAARAPSFHQSMYDTDAHAGTNGTQAVSGHASETDARSLISGGCLFMILIAIVAIAMYKTREKK